ncbi:hypothetical protein K439DRAFT_1662174 [Ramaria rubella]|nr:hypothetical protein K439DRAFT_1662174 [Ramaria rubella]
MSYGARGTLHDPDTHARARESRLQFPPSYALVGVYRLATDPLLYRPIWDKVKHGTQRGAIVGLGWTLLTFNIQRAFVGFFLVNSPRVTGLSHETIFGYRPPLDIVTYATIMFLSSQLNMILTFFLSRNLRLARERAWDQTVKSRGKGPEFWCPYVEEWQVPPEVEEGGRRWHKWVNSSLVRFVIKRVLLSPLDLYPFVGILLTSYLKAVGTARHLHKAYFDAKKMTPRQIAIFMEERKWDYQAFGFTASLLEGLPVLGLAFSISNRIGAAMWAHDLEKRQHLFASGALQPLPPRALHIPYHDEAIEMRPKGVGVGPMKEYSSGSANASGETSATGMAGEWNDGDGK